MAQETVTLYTAAGEIDPAALRLIREELGISQAEASSRVRAGSMAWYRWEADKHSPRPVYHPAIEELAAEAGIPVR